MIILGRGTSLSRLGVYDKVDDDVAIVNNFNHELDLDHVRHFLAGKRVTQFINREMASFLNKQHYINYDIGCVLNVLQKEYETSNIREVLNRNNVYTCCMPDKICEFSKDQQGGFPTTGILSVVYSTVILEHKDICIAGIDFYDTNYNSGRISQEYQTKKGLVMKEFLSQHIQKTPDVSYQICTDSDWRIDLPNLEFV
jgi:hypothetical protein